MCERVEEILDIEGVSSLGCVPPVHIIGIHGDVTTLFSKMYERSSRIFASSPRTLQPGGEWPRPPAATEKLRVINVLSGLPRAMSFHTVSWFRVGGGIPHGHVQFGNALSGSSWEDVKLIRGLHTS